MEIRINETNEIKTLEIIDPKTGSNWETDLLGNHGAEMGYDENDGVYTMDNDEFVWWEDLIERYQAVDNEFDEIRTNHPEGEELEKYIFETGISAGVELENYPEAITDAVNEWLASKE